MSVTIERLQEDRVPESQRVKGDPPPYLKLRARDPRLGGGYLSFTATVFAAREVVIEKKGLGLKWLVGTRWELWTKVPALLGEGTLGGIHEYDTISLPVNGVWLEFSVEASDRP